MIDFQKAHWRWLFISISCYILLVFKCARSNAQDGIGIGTEDVNDDAIFEIDSKTDGLLIPRMTSIQRIAIGASSRGLIVYDTSKKAFYYFDGDSWLRLIVHPAQIDLDMNNHRIIKVANGESATDAINKSQLDAKLSLSGGTMSGSIAMGNQKITSLAEGTGYSDAVNMGQLNTLEDKIGRLYAGECFIGDVSGSTIRTCSFDQNIGTNQYVVTGSLRLAAEDISGSWGNDDVTWIIINETATGFDISLEEDHTDRQNLIFRYVIFKM